MKSVRVVMSQEQSEGAAANGLVIPAMLATESRSSRKGVEWSTCSVTTRIRIPRVALALKAQRLDSKERAQEEPVAPDAVASRRDCVRRIRQTLAQRRHSAAVRV